MANRQRRSIGSVTLQDDAPISLLALVMDIDLTRAAIVELLSLPDVYAFTAALRSTDAGLLRDYGEDELERARTVRGVTAVDVEAGCHSRSLAHLVSLADHTDSQQNITLAHGVYAISPEPPLLVPAAAALSVCGSLRIVGTLDEAAAVLKADAQRSCPAGSGGANALIRVGECAGVSLVGEIAVEYGAKLEIENVRITGSANYGVSVAGKLTMRRSCVDSASLHGVLVRGTGDAALSHCSFLSNAGEGVACNGRCVIRGCTIADNAVGVCARDCLSNWGPALVTMEGRSVFENNGAAPGAPGAAPAARADISRAARHTVAPPPAAVSARIDERRGHACRLTGDGSSAPFSAEPATGCKVCSAAASRAEE